MENRKVIIINIFMFFCFINNFSQGFKILEKTITPKLSFDSLKSNDDNCLISIFYKEDGIAQDCDKSPIIKSFDKNCNLDKFKEKLINELNRSSFVDSITIHLYRIPKGSFYYLKDKNNYKTYIEDLMAFISNYNKEIYSTKSLSSFFDVLNTKTKKESIYNLVDSIERPINSLFEFSDTIYKKSSKPFHCPNNIYVLNRKKTDLISGNSCPTGLLIPIEDIFIKHLHLLFQPNLVVNQHVTFYKRKTAELQKKLDSINFNFSNKLGSINSLLNKTNIELIGGIGLLNRINSKGDLQNSQSSVSYFHNIELTFNKQINKKINLQASLGVLNSKGNFTMTNSKNNWNDDIGADYPLERIIEINEFEESWQINNGITAKIGIITKLNSIKDKLLISAGGDFGIVFPLLMKTKLEKGSFNYRGKIKNIEGELTNVNSLGLYENVSYPATTSQKSQFSGYVIDLNTSATYLISEKLYSKIFVQYSLYQLNNKDYNPDSNISLRYGEFSTSVFQMSSLNLSTFSLGLGVGIKF